MTGTGNSILVPLAGADEVGWGPARLSEPITRGVPLPRGAVGRLTDVAIESERGSRPAQAQALDGWPDGSIRWVLVDFLADAERGRAAPAALVIRPSAGAAASAARVDAPAPVSVVTRSDGVEVHSGGVVFQLLKGEPFPLAGALRDGVALLDGRSSGFRMIHEGRPVEFVTADVSVSLRGPLRAEVDVRARLRDTAAMPRLEIAARLEFLGRPGVVRTSITVRNPRRAQHAGGQWPLGDPGSVLIDSVGWHLGRPFETTRVMAAIEHGNPLEPFELPFTLLQESSGGDRWHSTTHRNRDGVVPHRFRGYRVRSGAAQRTGARATPIVVAGAGDHALAVAVPQFWETFPQSIAVDGRAVRLEFLPRDAADRHELQGGEQKTWRVVLAFGEDAVSDPPLAWCHDPLPLFPTPEWYCESEAVPFLMPARLDPEHAYLALVDAALEPDRGFAAKREQFDEFGWRHFGDLPADHESAFQPAGQPFVSHYNNQYDAIAAFAWHFLRTGDRRWHALMDDLARHVRDIDIYRTIEDRAAYNGGLFWHTYHYVDAGTSTHRTYPRGVAAGGGPSAEHNYNVGLMLHYFLTGDRASRDAAIGLAEWVLAMDDGRRTPFRWLASGPTGHASATGSPDYHGPGRGAANSISACRAACQLTGDRRFARKADELIRRCIHPRDNLAALNLLDTERRWYYTVFLQTLGAYLHEKAEHGEYDQMYGYARESLLHYARWMSDHERPYLDRPEVLEYPTETWAAQDLRKADVFWWAARHATAEEHRRFTERARFFFDYAVRTVASMPTRHFTRPVVLLLANGLRAGRFAGEPAAVIELPQPRVRPLPPFRPQKSVAMRRGRWLALALAGGGLAAALLALT